MSKTLLLHGWGGSDYPHWQSWLAGELAKDYGTVAFPLLDNPHFPSKNRWMRQVRGLLDAFAPETLICHSLANTLWFHLCHEGGMQPLKRLLLVAPPSLQCDIETIKTFFPLEPPKRLFAESAQMVISTDDPYLTQSEAQMLEAQLGIKTLRLENAGHINAESGYGPWPWVLDWARGGA